MQQLVQTAISLAALSWVMIGAAAAPAQKPIGMANPASVHCGNIGGKLEIHKDAAGNETGYCRMADGSICEEWALFRDQKCIAPKD
jgi:putative hemolysin